MVHTFGVHTLPSIMPRSSYLHAPELELFVNPSPGHKHARPYIDLRAYILNVQIGPLGPKVG